MPLRHCDYHGCSRPAERDKGDCMICSEHRCAVHLLCKFHSCPSEKNEPEDFYAAYDSSRRDHLEIWLKTVNFDALGLLASQLRDGMPCTIPAIRQGKGSCDPIIDFRMILDQAGGQNCHVDVHFKDGVKWIARLRLHEPTLPPREAQAKMFESEVATLRFLEATGIPAPRVYYAAFEGSEINTPFMLTQKLSGTPLDWTRCSAGQRTKVMMQLVDVFLEVEKYPMATAGSLSEDGTVGPFTQIAMYSSESHSIGPFQSFEQSLRNIIQHEMDKIEGGELTTFAADNYLTHLWRLEQVPKLVAEASDSSFYLRHFDDKGDHILVDEDHNITGIIDWEFASFETKAAAFTTPCMMWPVDKFYDGSNELSAEEIEFADMFRRRGRDDLAQLILQGRKYQRLLFFLGTRVSEQRYEFEALFQGLRKAFEDDMIETYSCWRQTVLEQAIVNSPPLKELLNAEMTADT